MYVHQAVLRVEISLTLERKSQIFFIPLYRIEGSARSVSAEQRTACDSGDLLRGIGSDLPLSFHSVFPAAGAAYSLSLVWGIHYPRVISA